MTPRSEARAGRRRRERLSARRALERHVLAVQRAVRSCAGCGACCTEEHNAAKILPVEARRIARHLAGESAGRRNELLGRLARAVERYRLRPTGRKVRYTCPFLDPDLACVLPLGVKPTVCLSFNPLGPDRCGQEPEWYFPAHEAEERANRAAGLPAAPAPIPVAVLAAVAKTEAPPAGAAPRRRRPASR